MQKGFRFRCYPDPAQEKILLRWIGCQRAIYNAKVGEDRYFRVFARKSLQHAGQYVPQDQQYSQFVSDLSPWMREVPSQVLRNGAVRWKQGYGRFYKKLAGRPTIQKKTGAQSVWLTSELFQFEQQIKRDTGEMSYRLRVGTKKFPVGEIGYKAHRVHSIPASITLTIEAGRWYLSFTNDNEIALQSKQETADWLATFDEVELQERAIGVDRGVAIPVMSSCGQAYDLTLKQRERIAKKQAAARRWQRKLSRRAKGGLNRCKAVSRIEAARQYEKNVRNDFAHQTSSRIVSDPRLLLFVFEALGVQRMTRKPKAKQDQNGRWLANSASVKAGLNKAILSSAWGKTKEFTSYKAQRAGKLVIEVPAHYTSQACSRCGYTHQDNRLSQAEFVCQRCGNTENADFNASQNIRLRGVALILSGHYRQKESKRVMRMAKKTLGADRSEVTPGEIVVSRSIGNDVALGSESQETTPPLVGMALVDGKVTRHAC